MPKAELGLKRGCLSCGMKFYDFNRTPIICPGCGAEFDPEALVRSRRSRAAAKPASKAAKATPESDPVETENDVDEAAEEEVVAQAGNAEAGETDEDTFDESDIDVSNDDSAGLIADDLDEEDEIIPGISTGDDD
ncbi:MAG: TIGR02300 family protein [Candidatus Puniceispirillaceae bacterium]